MTRVRSNITELAQPIISVIFIYEDIPGLIMQIADDGRGFEKKQKKWGIGLSSIRERAEAIRGKYEIETDSAGTEIKITVPLYSTLN